MAGEEAQVHINRGQAGKKVVDNEKQNAAKFDTASAKHKQLSIDQNGVPINRGQASTKVANNEKCNKQTTEH